MTSHLTQTNQHLWTDSTHYSHRVSRRNPTPYVMMPLEYPNSYRVAQSSLHIKQSRRLFKLCIEVLDLPQEAAMRVWGKGADLCGNGPHEEFKANEWVIVTVVPFTFAGTIKGEL